MKFTSQNLIQYWFSLITSINMTIFILFSIASILFSSTIFIRILILRAGILKKNGRTFVTHNTVFRVTESGKLYLQAQGGKFTDPFSLTISPENIDMAAFSKGQRLADNRLDRMGYLIFRVIHIQTRPPEPPLKTLVGDFTLSSAAQKKFSLFLLKNFL